MFESLSRVANTLKSSDRFSTIADELLQKIADRNACSASEIRTKIKKTYLHAVAGSYTEPLQRYLLSRKVSRTERLKMLALSKSKASREHPDGIHTFLGTLARFHINVDNIPFPAGKDADWNGIHAALRAIRSLLPGEPICELTYDSWMLLLSLFCNDQIIESIRRWFSAVEAEQRAASRLLRRELLTLSKHNDKLFEELQRVIREWFIPTVLFQVIFPSTNSEVRS